MSPSKLFVEACRKIAENIFLKFLNFLGLRFSPYIFVLMISQKISIFTQNCHRNFLLKCVVKLLKIFFGNF